MAPPSDNVTLGNDLNEIEQTIPCFLCYQPVDVRRDKHQKPYFVCEGCGIQAFIRRTKGMLLLKKLRDKSFLNLEVIQLSRELRFLKNEGDKLSSQRGPLGIFAPDSELIKAEQVINQKIKVIADKIKEITQGDKGP